MCYTEQSTATPALLDEDPNITNVSDAASETSDGYTKYEWSTPAGKREFETPTKAKEQELEENIKRAQDKFAKNFQEEEERLKAGFYKPRPFFRKEKWVEKFGRN